MAFTFNNDYSANASDEISIFLRQLLHRSSSTSSSPPAAQSGQFNAELSSSSAALPNTDSHLTVQSTMTIFDSDKTMIDRASAACYPLSTCWSDIPPTVCSNMTSDSQAAGAVELRSTETDPDDYACDSEDEGLEEAQPNYKQNHARNSSKRSRAAEVHNMSEKRRRSRINEKMKALQDLIPNSNKTDKASMLDEAIEYLKQLQLQVQMLSMRNGLIMNPMCLPGFPGVFDPVQMEFNINGTSNPTILPSGSAPPPFSLQSSMDNIQASSQRVDDTMAQHQLPITPSQTNELESLISPVSSNCTSHIGLCRGRDDI